MKRLGSSSFIRGIAVLASGTVLAQAIPIAFTPVISRLFTPDDFGILGLFTSFIAMAVAVVALSFPLAIVSAESRRVSAQLAVISFAVVIPMATILAGILAIFRHGGILGFGELPPVSIPIVWLTSAFIGVFVTLRYWHVRESQFSPIAKATVGQSIGRVVTQIATGILSLGGVGLLVSEVVGRGTGVMRLGRMAVKEIPVDARDTPRSEYLAVIREFRKFPLLSTPSTLINSLSQALPVPLLAAAYSLTISGQFSMAYRVLALPIAVVGAAVADVFHGHLAKLARQNMARARRLFLQVAAALLLLGALPSIIIVLWGPEIFSFVLGDQWSAAGVIASGIMPWLLASFVVSPLSRVVLVFQGQGKKLIYDILAIIGVVACIQVGSSYDFSIERTATLLGISQSVVYVIYFILLWGMMPKNDVPPSENSVEVDSDSPVLKDTDLP